MNRNSKRLIFAGVAVALVAGAAVSYAHDRGRGYGGHHRGGHEMGGHGPRGPVMHLFTYLDANDDGALGRDEAQSVVEAKLAEFDASGDGAIDLQEFEALWVDFSRGRMVDGFQRLDDDGDGQITQAEMTRPIDQIFRRADRNEDGVLDRSDRRERGRRGRFRDDAGDN